MLEASKAIDFRARLPTSNGDHQPVKGSPHSEVKLTFSLFGFNQDQSHTKTAQRLVGLLARWKSSRLEWSPAWHACRANDGERDMFKNTFQSGFLSILYSIGSKPLQIWDSQGPAHVSYRLHS